MKTSLYNILKRCNFSDKHLFQAHLMIEPIIVRLTSSKITKSELRKLSKNLVYCETVITKPTEIFNLKEYHKIRARNNESWST